MFKRPAVLLACVSMPLFAGVAVAGTPEWRSTSVGLPDGSVAQIRYVGDVPPTVTVAMPAVQKPRRARQADGGMPGARRIVEARPSGPEQASPQFIVGAGMPRGSHYYYTLITTGTDGKVCVQRTDYLSRGRRKTPQMTRTDTGEGCAARPSAD